MPVLSHEVFDGALVSWSHKPRGGYGYLCLVDATVEALSPDGTRARIIVETAQGKTVRRTVSIGSLRWRRTEKPARPVA